MSQLNEEVIDPQRIREVPFERIRFSFHDSSIHDRHRK